jgi:hypothetical protein
VRSLLLVPLFSLCLAGSDYSGIWVGQIPARNGEMQDIAFQFTQTGSKLSGKLYGDYQSAPIVEGTVAGHLVTFVVLASEQAGNQINQTRIRFTGTLQDGVMDLMRERESSTNAGNRGGTQTARPSARTTFKLKRLL